MVALSDCRVRRTAKGWSVSELARRAAVSDRAVILAEQGASISLREASQLEDALGPVVAPKPPPKPVADATGGHD